MKLGGELIGYEIHKKNGEVIHHEFDTPIKNTLTKHCLNNMLMYNGSDALGPALGGAALFVSVNSSETRTGVFNYCAYGDGTEATGTSDSDLKNRLVNPMSTKKQAGSYYNCSRCGTDDKMIRIRITHRFPAVSEATNINEIGWFHKVEPSGSFTMSSRVKLEETISLNSGDVFECTYQFNIIFDWTPTIIKNFFNGFDARKCTNLGGPSEINNWRYTDDHTWIPFPWVKKNGIAGYFWEHNSTGMAWSYKNSAAKNPVYCLQSQVDQYSSLSFGGTIAPILSSFNLPTNFNDVRDPNTVNYKGMGTIQIRNYTLDSFYREYVITCNDLWCDNRDVYGIAYNGEIYQFGHELDGTFTPAPIHKDTAKTWTFTFRQSWSTDQLSPNI